MSTKGGFSFVKSWFVDVNPWDKLIIQSFLVYFQYIKCYSIFGILLLLVKTVVRTPTPQIYVFVGP